MDNMDNMSFASDRYYENINKIKSQKNMNKKVFQFQNLKQQITSKNKTTIAKSNNYSPIISKSVKNQIPQKSQTAFYLGVIGSIDIFQQLLLEQNQITIVFCFVKQKPKNINFPYYLYHTSKNSAIIYIGYQRVCEFFIQNMNQIPKQIQKFIRQILKNQGIQCKQNQNFQEIEHQKQKQIKINKVSKRNNGKQKNQEIQGQSSLKYQEQRQNYQNLMQQKQVFNNNFFIPNNNIQDDQQQDSQINNNNRNTHNKQNPKKHKNINKFYYQQDQQQSNLQEQNKSQNNGKYFDHQEQDIPQNDQNQLLQESSSGQLQDEDRKQQQRKQSLLENLLKLRNDQQITELQFYKMKSQLLQSLSDFMRKYQMGTRKGFRNHKKLFNENNNLQVINRKKQNFKRNQQSKGKKENIQVIQTQQKSRSKRILYSQQQNQNQMQRKKLKQQDKQRERLNQKSKQLNRRQRKNQNNKDKFRERQKERERQRERERQNQKKRQKQSQQIRQKQKINLKQREKERRNNRQRQRQRLREKQRQDEHIIQNKSQFRPTYSRQTKKYQIPIIVRKYNNVIQKISTSYPLTQQQQQAINLILQLQLKGLISQKQSGIYKTSILQQDYDVLSLFLDYFDVLIDQIQLVSQLKKLKNITVSQNRQQNEHNNMRLLIKYSKQSNYEILRNLLIQKNPHLIKCLQKFRIDKNQNKLKQRLQKITEFQKQKNILQNALNY